MASGELVTDIGLGTQAYDATRVLAGAGFSLRWHPDQHPLSRGRDFYGFPIEQPS